MTETHNRYIYWLDDLSILYKDGKYTEIIPNGDMTRVEQLNAMIRFSIYAFLLLFIFNKSSYWYYIPFIIMTLSVIFYNIYNYDPVGKEKEVYKQHNKNLGGNEGYDTVKLSQEINNSNKINNHLETGYYDSNGKLIIGENFNKKKKNLNRLDYNLNELDEYQKASCRKPTKDNPFMNPPITDFSKEFSPSACNADDEDIKDMIEDNFNADLYRDLDDLFDIKNSQRQFYTVPVTSIPNAQDEFANWLYKTPMTCKDSSEMCLRYEDLRYKR
jgi:hypothetical protein